MVGRAEVVWDEVREELRQLVRDTMRDAVCDLRELLRRDARADLGELLHPRGEREDHLRRSAAAEGAEALPSHTESFVPLPGSVPTVDPPPGAPRCLQQLAADNEGGSTGGTSGFATWKERRAVSETSRRPRKYLDCVREQSPRGRRSLDRAAPASQAKQIPVLAGGPSSSLPRLLAPRVSEASVASKTSSIGPSANDLESLGLPSRLPSKATRLPSKGDSRAFRRSTFRRSTFSEPASNIKSIWRSTMTMKMEKKAGGGTESEMLARVRGASPKAIERFSTVGFQGFIKAWVASPCFDYFMGVLLVCNALVVGMQVDYVARNRDTAVPRYFRALDTFFCVVFSAELMLRIFASGCGFFRIKEGWKWNWFDTVLVCFAVTDELALVLLEGTGVQELIASLGVLRILRLGRIVRLVRMVRLIPELKSMVYLITASMSSFCWTVVLLLMLVYCFAVYFTELATELSRQGSPEDKGLQAMMEYWGSVPRSTLALFMAISGGDDWRNFVDVFNDSTSSYLLNMVLFSTYIAFATMVMLNLVTGVFVDGAQKMFNQEQEDQLVRIAARIFVDARKDSSDTISFEEFARLVATRCLDDWFAALGFSLSEADKLFQVIDEDGSGSLSLSEFVRGCLRLKGNVKACDLALLTYNLKTQGVEIAKAIARVEDTLRSILATCSGPMPESRPAARPHAGSVGWCNAAHVEEEI